VKERIGDDHILALGEDPAVEGDGLVAAVMKIKLVIVDQVCCQRQLPTRQVHPDGCRAVSRVGLQEIADVSIEGRSLEVELGGYVNGVVLVRPHLQRFRDASAASCKSSDYSRGQPAHPL
jgi:hypothetical protein